jgi:hypothetical protein
VPEETDDARYIQVSIIVHRPVMLSGLVKAGVFGIYLHRTYFGYYCIQDVSISPLGITEDSEDGNYGILPDPADEGDEDDPEKEDDRVVPDRGHEVVTVRIRSIILETAGRLIPEQSQFGFATLHRHEDSMNEETDVTFDQVSDDEDDGGR